MTIRVLACWALCAALVSADDKPKATNEGAKTKPQTEEVKKPTTAAEAVKAMNAAKLAAMKAKSVDEFVAGQDKVIAAADAALGFKDATTELTDKALVGKVTALAAKANYKPDAAKDYEAFAAMVEKDHPKSPAMATIDMMKFRKKFMKTRAAKVDPAAVEELVRLGKKYPSDNSFASVYGSYAGLVERTDGVKAAIKFLEDGVKNFGDDEGLTGAALAGLKVMGNTMKLVGPTLEGSEFNVASLKGKVVLVDFWATSCGPCVGELPNVKAAYEKYHSKGFEIVGVSFDNSREPLEKFVKEKDVPWTQIIFSDEKDMGWKNPIGKQYGIRSIPATYLIGRDGKVVSRNLRGPALEKAVAAELAKSSTLAN